MVFNFLGGGAGINVLARHVGAEVWVVDVGVNHDFDRVQGLIDRKLAHGTANLAQGPAMGRELAEEAVLVGADLAQAAVAKGFRAIATGEMGIGNTTPASAIVAAFTGRPAAEVTGLGAGLDEAGRAKKVQVIERALAVNQPDPADPLDVLAKVGGLEIGAIAGLCLGGAAARVPVVVDGFISTAGALVAARLCPNVTGYLVSAHKSVEIGHAAMLEAMGLKPLVDLDLRLGEGTGAALGLSLVEAAVKVMTEMATFESAGVSNRTE
jgi:nicotinate-nucleotide--dimethylbenzimidazole phosphoribosyltransferase